MANEKKAVEKQTETVQENTPVIKQTEAPTAPVQQNFQVEMPPTAMQSVGQNVNTEDLVEVTENDGVKPSVEIMTRWRANQLLQKYAAEPGRITITKDPASYGAK